MKLHVTDSFDLLQFTPHPSFLVVTAMTADKARALTENWASPQAFFDVERGKAVAKALGLSYGYQPPVPEAPRKPTVCPGDAILVVSLRERFDGRWMANNAEYLLVDVTL